MSIAGMAKYAYNPRTQEAKAGWQSVQGQPGLHTEYQAAQTTLQDLISKQISKKVNKQTRPVRWLSSLEALDAQSWVDLQSPQKGGWEELTPESFP